MGRDPEAPRCARRARRAMVVMVVMVVMAGDGGNGGTYDDDDCQYSFISLVAAHNLESVSSSQQAVPAFSRLQQPALDPLASPT